MEGSQINTASVLGYLQAIKNLLNGKQLEYYQWILNNGKYFKGTARDKRKEHELIQKKYPHRQKNCYYNSQMLCLDYEDFEYYEGWYLPEKLIPMEHGFVIYKDRVIDLTANGNGEVEEYFGVNIPISFIRDWILKTGMAETILSRYWSNLQK